MYKPPKGFLNIHNFVEGSTANGPGRRAVVWVQGCPRRCLGCWNPTSLPFQNKDLVPIQELAEKILSLPNIDGVTFSGGEPFSQAEGLAQLAKLLKPSGLTIVCYTGHPIEQIKKVYREDWNNLLSQIDLLVDGEYKQEFPSNEPLKGSQNQRLHFLTGDIQPEEVLDQPQRAEFSLAADGVVTTTGYPKLQGLDKALKLLEA